MTAEAGTSWKVFSAVCAFAVLFGGWVATQTIENGKQIAILQVQAAADTATIITAIEKVASR